MRRTRRKGLTVTMTFIGLMFAVSCATNSMSGNKELALVSESSEIEMGRQGAANVTATIGPYPDVGLQAYVWRIGHGVSSQTERPTLPWDYHIVDDAAVNAFLPSTIPLAELVGSFFSRGVTCVSRIRTARAVAPGEAPR